MASKIRTIFLWGVATLFYHGVALSDGIDLDHLYQLTEQVNSEILQLHKTNLSQPLRAEREMRVSDKLPRHVFQKAQDLYLKTQKLKTINGLKVKPTPLIPAHEIGLSDVKEILSQTLSEVRDLKSTFGASRLVRHVELSKNKKPSDIYQNLINATYNIQGLDLPQTTPSDVYQTAMFIHDELDHILKTLNDTPTSKVQFISQGKRPVDVYRKVYEAIERLDAIVQSDSRLAIQGGVNRPIKKTGNINSQHVLDLMINLAADLHAIKTKLGIKTPSRFSDVEKNKTPSDNYDIFVDVLDKLNRMQG